MGTKTSSPSLVIPRVDCLLSVSPASLSAKAMCCLCATQLRLASQELGYLMASCLGLYWPSLWCWVFFRSLQEALNGHGASSVLDLSYSCALIHLL